MAPITPNYCLTQEILSNDFTEKKNYVVDNKKYRYLEYSCLTRVKGGCVCRRVQVLGQVNGNVVPGVLSCLFPEQKVK